MKRGRFCPHPLSSLRPEVLFAPRTQASDAVVRVAVSCACGARLSFLGLPSAFLPDAPHPSGGEDDGTDSRIAFLPGIWVQP